MIFRYKIEIISDIEQKIRKLLVNIAVAPFVGVWVEMERTIPFALLDAVAPFVGVWVEINTLKDLKPLLFCRSLRGSVG